MNQYADFVIVAINMAEHLRIMYEGGGKAVERAARSLGVEITRQDLEEMQCAESSLDLGMWMEFTASLACLDAVPVPPRARKFVDALKEYAEVYESFTSTQCSDEVILTKEVKNQFEEKLTAIAKAAQGVEILERLATPVHISVRNELQQLIDNPQGTKPCACGGAGSCACSKEGSCCNK